MTIAIVGSIGLTLIAAWFLIEPHLAIAPEASDVEYSEATILSDQRERLVQMIKDLDLDLSTGKISPEDHTNMRAPLLSELSVIVKKLRVLSKV